MPSLTHKYTRWEAHKHCIICGEENPFGLGIRFTLTTECHAEAHWIVRKQFQGYVGLLQGGITVALLDSAMVNCLRLQGIEAFTAEMNVRFVLPIPVSSPLHIVGKLVRSRKNLHWTEATVLLDGCVAASASGKFIAKS